MQPYTKYSLVKTLDPVVLFGNLGYSTTLGVPDNNQFPYSFGMGFSLNDRVSFSMSMSGAAALKRTETLQNTKKITLPAQDINTLQFSTTIQMKKNLSVEPFVGFGLTAESPDFTFGVRLPYRFEGKHPLRFLGRN
jgi:hypothetical protein